MSDIGKVFFIIVAFFAFSLKRYEIFPLRILYDEWMDEWMASI